MQRVTIVGLGIIGSTWAQNLHADGLTVRAWNRTPKALPFFEPDLVQAIHDAELIILVVADPPAVNGILDIIAPHLRAGQIVAQSSTISPRWTKEFAARVEAAGAAFLEAPFTGSKIAAEQRKTVFYLGGDAALAEKAKPVLERLAARIFHIGPLGTASTLKLAMNLNIALIAEALSEGLALARAGGITDETFFDVLQANVARSGVSDLKAAKFRAGDFSPQFSLKHMDKDLRLAIETAGELHLPVAEALKAHYDKGMAAGFGEDDFIGLIRLLRPPKRF